MQDEKDPIEEAIENAQWYVDYHKKQLEKHEVLLDALKKLKPDA